MLPDPLKKFIDLVAMLPGIGPRQATRVGFHLVNQGKAAIDELARGVAALGGLQNCGQCFRAAKTGAAGLCGICADQGRRADTVAIVEKDTDLMSLESAKRFAGTYLVLGELSRDGFLSPLQKLRVGALKDRLRGLPGGRATEVVVALNPTSYGNLQAETLIAELKPLAAKVSRLGRGLPTGGEIEFADEETLGGALEHRA